MDTPIPERRRSWLSRQIGSIRSSVTAYSGGGVYNKRNRQNSVYSSPEPPIPGQQNMMPPPAHKTSFYKKTRQLIKQSKNIYFKSLALNFNS